MRGGRRFLGRQVLFSMALFSSNSGVRQGPGKRLCLCPLVTVTTVLTVIFMVSLPRVRGPGRRLSRAVHVPTNRHTRVSLPSNSMM